MAETFGNKSEAKIDKPLGLFESVRELWGLLLAVLFSRLTLATSELEDERERLEKLILLAVLALLFAGLGLFTLTLLIVFLIWDSPYRLEILGATVLFFFVLSGSFALAIRNQLLHRPKFLGQTLEELQRDFEGIRQITPTVGEKAK